MARIATATESLGPFVALHVKAVSKLRSAIRAGTLSLLHVDCVMPAGTGGLEVWHSNQDLSCEHAAMGAGLERGGSGYSNIAKRKRRVCTV